MNRSDLEPFTEKLFSRSSGAGGQNVNKVNTKVQLQFHIAPSGLSEAQKSTLFKRHPEGVIRIESQETRSQARNIDLAFERLLTVIQQALRPVRKRKQVVAPFLTRTGKLKKMLKDKLMKYRESKWN